MEQGLGTFVAQYEETSMLSGIHGHQDIERVVYGKPAGAAVLAEAERLGAKRVFVTTSKSVAQSPLLADVVSALGNRHAGTYAGMTAHSPRPCVIEGARLAREAEADLVVSVGGGSAIDATKVMLIALWQSVTRIEDLDAYRASWGFGFRWFSPIGPLRFEWGIPFKTLPGEQPIVFEFTIGNFF